MGGGRLHFFICWTNSTSCWRRPSPETRTVYSCVCIHDGFHDAPHSSIPHLKFNGMRMDGWMDVPQLCEIFGPHPRIRNPGRARRDAVARPRFDSGADQKPADRPALVHLPLFPSSAPLILSSSNPHLRLPPAPSSLTSHQPPPLVLSLLVR